MGLSIRAWIEVAAVIVIALGVAYWRHELILEGETLRGQADTKARQEQKDADAKTASTTIQTLQDDKARLLAQLNAPASAAPIRSCGGELRVDTLSKLRAGSAAGPAQPELPPNGAVNPSVPSRGDGGDVGPGVRDIALAGELLADYRQRLWDLEMKETSNGRSHP